MAVAPLHTDAFVGFPFIQHELVRHHPQTRFLREQARFQPSHRTRAQVKHDHASLRDIGLEQVLRDKACQVLNALGARRLVGYAHQVGLEFDPECPRTEVPRGINRHAAIAGAKIHHKVVAGGIGHLQHAADQPFRRRHPDRILADLADLRRVASAGGLCLRCTCGKHERKNRYKRIANHRAFRLQLRIN